MGKLRRRLHADAGMTGRVFARRAPPHDTEGVDEPQDERFNAPALRPAWEGVRELGSASVTATARAAPGREGLDFWATVQIPGVGADETAVGGVEALSGLFPGGVGEKPGR